MTQAGYQYLTTFQLSSLIYDLTIKFLEKVKNLLSRRQIEQMEQAARSGKMNIAEGYAQKTSLKGYIKLLGIARGSLEELKLDYIDFLKNNRLQIYPLTHPKIREFRKIKIREIGTIEELRKIVANVEEFCNFMITLISQNTYLLDKQIQALIDKHTKEGGFTEKLYQRRIKFRKLQKTTL